MRKRRNTTNTVAAALVFALLVTFAKVAYAETIDLSSFVDTEDVALGVYPYGYDEDDNYRVLMDALGYDWESMPADAHLRIKQDSQISSVANSKSNVANILFDTPPLVNIIVNTGNPLTFALNLFGRSQVWAVTMSQKTYKDLQAEVDSVLYGEEGGGGEVDGSQSASPMLLPNTWVGVYTWTNTRYPNKTGIQELNTVGVANTSYVINTSVFNDLISRYQYAYVLPSFGLKGTTYRNPPSLFLSNSPITYSFTVTGNFQGGTTSNQSSLQTRDLYTLTLTSESDIYVAGSIGFTQESDARNLYYQSGIINGNLTNVGTSKVYDNLTCYLDYGNVHEPLVPDPKPTKPTEPTGDDVVAPTPPRITPGDDEDLIPNPIYNPEVTGTDYTDYLKEIILLLKEINSSIVSETNAMAEHCLHIQDKMAEVGDSLMDYMSELYEHWYMDANELFEDWFVYLANTVDYNIQDAKREIVRWLKLIYSRLGGNGISKPDPTTDPDGFWDWLMRMIGDFIADILGKTDETVDELTGAFQNLITLFPLSIPWDLVALFTLFVAEPVTPVCDVPMPVPAIIDEDMMIMVHVDLTGWNDTAAIMRAMELVFFTYYLIRLTPTMFNEIKVGDDW